MNIIHRPKLRFPILKNKLCVLEHVRTQPKELIWENIPDASNSSISSIYYSVSFRSISIFSFRLFLFFFFCFLMLRFRKQEDEWDTDDSSLALIHSKKWLIKSEVYFSSHLGILRLFSWEISLENIFHISSSLPVDYRKIPASSVRKSEQYRSWD